MLNGRQRFGKESESRAEEYLRRRGYRIIARNVKSVSGELDLVADDGGVLVFVEVKARQTDAFGGADYAVDARKQSRIVRQAAQFLARHRIRNRPCRFDVVLVQTTKLKDGQIELIQDAFQVREADLHYS